MFRKQILIPFAAMLAVGPAGCGKSHDDVPKAVNVPEDKRLKPRSHGGIKAGGAPNENEGENK